MAARKIGLELWLGGVIVLWALHPLLFSQARGIVILACITALLALLGWLTGYQPLIVWSGGIGLCNLTLALVLAAHPPSFWAGLSAGLTLLALVDGSHRLTYLRHCWIEAGVIPAILGAFVRLSGLTLVAGVLLGLLVTLPGMQVRNPLLTGGLTIVGAGVFVTFLTLYLGYTSRWPQH